MLIPVKIRARTLIVSTIVLCVIIMVSVIEKVDPLFVTVMIAWFCLFVYSVMNFRKSALLFCYMISFFVFLLGRQVCFHYLHQVQVYQFLDEVNNRTYICLIISIVGLAIGIYFSSRLRIKAFFQRKGRIRDFGNGQRSYQIATELMFAICFLASVSSTLIQISFVRKVGYLSSYMDESGGAGIPTIIVYLSRFTPVVFCLFLATKPKKIKAIVPILLYELYAVVTLMTGQRYPFIGISMLILVYYVLRSRQEKGWIRGYHYVLLAMAIPALILFLTAYDAIRQGGSFSSKSLADTLQKFFVQQGGSVNVIRRTIYNSEQLEDMKLVSFQSIYSSLFENGISRRLFHITTYSGNSIERALNTSNLAHRLSYIAYGDGYLSGKGTGTSYIAELLHDFGIFGVFSGSVFYGIIIDRIDKMEFSHVFGDGIKLAFVYYLLLSPRGQFDSFIGSVFNLQTLFGFALFWGTYKVIGMTVKFNNNAHCHTTDEGTEAA